MTLCDECRRKIAEGTRRGMREAKRAGKRFGRPRVEIPDRVFVEIDAGRMSASNAADIYRTTPQLINRRLRERRRAKRGKP